MPGKKREAEPDMYLVTETYIISYDHDIISQVFLRHLWEEGILTCSATRGILGLLRQGLSKCEYRSKLISVDLILESLILCV